VLGYVIMRKTCGPQYLQIYCYIRAVSYNCLFCSLKLDWVQTTVWLFEGMNPGYRTPKIWLLKALQNESGKNLKVIE